MFFCPFVYCFDPKKPNVLLIIPIFILVCYSTHPDFRVILLKKIYKYYILILLNFFFKLKLSYY